MSLDVSTTLAVSGGDAKGRNFRRAYYESLLLREEEEKNIGCLQSLLKAECIGRYMYTPESHPFLAFSRVSADVEALKRFCQKHTLPPYHRFQVWKIVLGKW